MYICIYVCICVLLNIDENIGLNVNKQCKQLFVLNQQIYKREYMHVKSMYVPVCVCIYVSIYVGVMHAHVCTMRHTTVWLSVPWVGQESWSTAHPLQAP